MIRFCELSRMKIRLLDTSLPHFSKTLHSLYLILSWKGIVKSNTKFNNNLRRGLVFLCVYFYPHFSTRTIRKSVAERAGCSKQALLFEENISLIQSGINETITKLSWNFSNKKKRKKWNRQRKVSWRGDRTWVHGQNGLYDVRTDLKSREVLLPITRFVVTTWQSTRGVSFPARTDASLSCLGSKWVEVRTSSF